MNHNDKQDTHVLCVGVNPAFDVTIKLTSLEPGEVSRAYEDKTTAAGKALNVLRALLRSGHEAEYICMLGENNMDAYAAGLDDLGTSVYVVQCEGATRENLTLLVDGMDKEYKINRPGFSITDDDYDQLAQLVDDTLRSYEGDKIAVFSGSMPPGMDPGQYGSLILKAKRAGALVAVDTEELSETQLILLSPWLYKPNDRELIRLLRLDNVPDRSEPELYRDYLINAAIGLCRRGVQNILLTLGRYGLVLVSDGAVAAILNGSGTVLRDSTGAGDRALAGFISAHLRGCTPAECARAAIRSAETVD